MTRITKSAVSLLLALAIVVLLLPAFSIKADAAKTLNGGTLNSATFILDAGHGGTDPGAVNGSRHESDDNLRMTRRVGELIIGAGETAAFTRIDDTFVSLADRASMEKSGSFKYFISFHRNSSNGAGYGIETYYYTGSSTGLALATPVHNAITALNIFRDRGIKTNTYYVLKNTRAPAILIELGFIDNASDNQILDNNFESIAAAIAGALLGIVGKSLDTTPPSISNVQITNRTADGYTVSCTATAGGGISSVKMPTWTLANDQDDLIWHVASRSGNTFTYNVKISEHKNEHGLYVTHIYAYNNSGASASYACPVVDVSAYTLDINGYINDTYWQSPSVSYGTFDLTVGGSKVAEDQKDHCQSYLSGSSYTLNDIKNGAGYQYKNYLVSSSSDAPGYGASKKTGNSISGTLSSYIQIVLYYETTYNIAYDLSGGSGTASGGTYSWSQEVTIAGSPSRNGYTFGGWLSNKGISYSAGQKVSKLSASAGDTVTLTAQWTPVSYSITFAENGGAFVSGYTKPQSYNITSKNIELPSSSDIERTGFDFGGWYTDSDLSGSPVTAITSGSTGNKTFYAKWNEKTYTVTFTAGENGTLTASEPVYAKYGTGYKTIQFPGYLADKGYHFKEWRIASGTLGENETITENIEVRAIFEADPEPEYVVGDVNEDGEIDSSDALLVLRYDAGLTSLGESRLLAADTNRDTDVDTADAVLILRFDAGLISEF